MLAIPASSADAERGFSYVKNTKTNSRNKLLDSHLSDQLTIVLESPPVGKFDPVPAIDLWNCTPRRVRQSQGLSSTSAGQVQAVEKTSLGSGVVNQQVVIIDDGTDDIASGEPETN